MTGAESVSELDVLDRGIQILTAHLPPGWTAQSPLLQPHPDADGALDLVSPDGTRAMLIFEAKRVVNSRDVPTISDQIDRYLGAPAGHGSSVGVVVARYLSPPVRMRLKD